MISAIFSCMNRTENLSTALDSWVNSHHSINDIVVVDWSSKKPIYENSLIRRLVDERKVKVIRVEKEKYFSLPKSYNLAFRYTSKVNKILLKLDADYVLKDSRWLDHICSQINGDEGISNNGKLSDYFIVGSHMFSKSYTGFILLNKENFVQYNENMQGYGYDDLEMYIRMKSAYSNLAEIVFFNIKDYIYHIPHSDEERVANYENKNLKETNLQNMKISASWHSARYRELSCQGNLITLERI